MLAIGKPISEALNDSGCPLNSALNELKSLQTQIERNNNQQAGKVSSAKDTPVRFKSKINNKVPAGNGTAASPYTLPSLPSSSSKTTNKVVATNNNAVAIQTIQTTPKCLDTQVNGSAKTPQAGIKGGKRKN